MLRWPRRWIKIKKNNRDERKKTFSKWRHLEGGLGGVGGVLVGMHGCSRTIIDPHIPATLRGVPVVMHGCSRVAIDPPHAYNAGTEHVEFAPTRGGGGGWGGLLLCPPYPL